MILGVANFTCIFFCCGSKDTDSKNTKQDPAHWPHDWWRALVWLRTTRSSRCASAITRKFGTPCWDGAPHRHHTMVHQTPQLGEMPGQTWCLKLGIPLHSYSGHGQFNKQCCYLVLSNPRMWKGWKLSRSWSETFWNSKIGRKFYVHHVLSCNFAKLNPSLKKMEKVENDLNGSWPQWKMT